MEIKEEVKNLESSSNEEIKLKIINLTNEYNALGMKAEKIIDEMDKIDVVVIECQKELKQRNVI